MKNEKVHAKEGVGGTDNAKEDQKPIAPDVAKFKVLFPHAELPSERFRNVPQGLDVSAEYLETPASAYMAVIRKYGVSTTGAGLEHLAKKINDTSANVETAVKSARERIKEALDLAITCGQLLLDAKALCVHGEFGAWIKHNCHNISERTAQRYMKLAERVKANPSYMTDFKSINQAYIAIGMMPEPEKKPRKSSGDEKQDHETDGTSDQETEPQPEEETELDMVQHLVKNVEPCDLVEALLQVIMKRTKHDALHLIAEIAEYYQNALDQKAA